MKSEPERFGIDDLAEEPAQDDSLGRRSQFSSAQTSCAIDMQRGDLAFFYHSNCDEPGIAGVVKIVKEGYPDHTAFDATAIRTSTQTAIPRSRVGTWSTCNCSANSNAPITLATLREHSNGALRRARAAQRGNRLSVTPVSDAHWKFIRRSRVVASVCTRERRSSFDVTECATNHTPLSHARDEDAQKFITRWKFRSFYIYSTPSIPTTETTHGLYEESSVKKASTRVRKRSAKSRRNPRSARKRKKRGEEKAKRKKNAPQENAKRSGVSWSQRVFRLTQV